MFFSFITSSEEVTWWLLISLEYEMLSSTKTKAARHILYAQCKQRVLNTTIELRGTTRVTVNRKISAYKQGVMRRRISRRKDMLTNDPRSLKIGVIIGGGEKVRWGASTTSSN